MKRAVYPGSFDPCTNGHMDIIDRASKMFDELIVAILTNTSKVSVFNQDERMEMLKIVTKGYSNVKVLTFSGLLADFIKTVNAGVIIKGLRAVSDFEYEFQMALTNKELNPQAETLFLPADKEFMFLSSSIVRDVAKLGGNLSGFVPREIMPFIAKMKG